MIPYGRQEILECDVEAVVDVLRSDYITQGLMVPEFERQLAAHVGCRFGVAVNSATSALHIACLAMGVGPGDVVWTSPITFVASANCALYCGASVEFVDVDPLTGNMCPDALQRKLESAKKMGKLPKVIIPVHFAGQSCDMAALSGLARQFGSGVIEDASHAVGGRYQQKFIGSCEFSDITVFSFHPVKIITTGEGGMAVTNNPKIAEMMQLLRSHGVTRDPELMNRSPEGAWYYEQIALGFNYRMTDIQAALGRSQLGRLDHYVKARNALAGRYDNLLSDVNEVKPLYQDKKGYSAYHLYVILLDDAIKVHKSTLFDFFKSKGISINVHYKPVPTQPYYERLGFQGEDYPNSHQFYSRAISLPLYPSLETGDVEYIVNHLKEFIREL